MNIFVTPNKARVLLSPFVLTTEERSIKVIKRIFSLSEDEVNEELEVVLNGFESRHRNLEEFLLQRFETKKHLIPKSYSINESQKLLIGSYFTCEYSLEAAALFNPSMVWHPDQTELPDGSRRFIISLRAAGEGHISSIVFRSGIVDSDLNIKLDETSRYATAAAVKIDDNDYDAHFTSNLPISERVLFPSAPIEKNGMEDARFVEFRDEGGGRIFYATYTAYDGARTYSRLVTTDDFLHFQIESLKGPAIENKGLALFPRKINGRYAMLSRQDNENNYIMFSDKLHQWKTKRLLLEPEKPWDFVQVGNCGSPLETELGWLVFSHGVGSMRRYVMSAFLLDSKDPTKVIGRLKQPILAPNEREREGYVPNVIYSCGSQIHNSHLIIPYAMSDYACGFASVNLDELLSELKESTAD